MITIKYYFCSITVKYVNSLLGVRSQDGNSTMLAEIYHPQWNMCFNQIISKNLTIV